LTATARFVKVAEKSDIPPGTMKKITLKEKEILLVNVDGTYYAIHNRCTHAGGDLSQGVLDGHVSPVQDTNPDSM